MRSGSHAPRRPADVLTAAMSKPMKLGPRRNPVTVQRDLRVPMRDGTILLADHYAPVGTGPRPTVLMRSPYGRGPQFAVLARPYAERGYHVLLQSSRGTFGSGGQFTPAADEQADGQDTVTWLRTNDWFNGKLVLAGPSYLAFAAWALAIDPPPELTAMALSISPHDLAAAGFGHGPFELHNLLWWSDLMASQERYSMPRMMWRAVTADRRLRPAMERLPVVATGAELIARAPWYGDWLAHPDRGDAFWTGYSAAAALTRVRVPTLLVTGWHDFFVEQTLAQYQVLRERGVTVSLTVGPWNHLNLDMGVVIRQSVAWFDAYASGTPAPPAGNTAAPPPRPGDVRVWESGSDEWREFDHWPPAGTTNQSLFLRSGGRLTAQPPDDDGEVSEFRYDPADPTPSVGGRLMSLKSGGSRDNSAIEARPDVLTFTTAPLSSGVEVAGVPAITVHVSSDNARHDLFVRLCDVGPDGRSMNLTDQIERFVPDQVVPGTIRQVDLRLTDIAHVFLPGHRIRLQIAGGAHPRFARNLGTDADMVYGTRLAPVTHRVQHSSLYPSALVLPVAAASRDVPAGHAATTAGASP